MKMKEELEIWKIEELMEQYGHQNNKKQQYTGKNYETCADHNSIPAQIWKRLKKILKR